MNARSKKFLSYYKPYWRLLFTDLGCALVASAITLALPLITRYLLTDVLGENMADARMQIYAIGAGMVGLIALHTLCDMYVAYQGHMMGTLMERDMRAELFDHYQKLSFGFFDQQKVGQLMTRISNDLFSLGELYHHGPEDIAIALIKLIGIFAILGSINLELTLLIFGVLPFVGVYAFYFNRRMNVALRASKDRIGDINAQVEETLGGIRVVKSFANEEVESQKFAYANNRFVESRRAGYLSETYFHEGLLASTHLITVAVIILGGIAILNAQMNLADLVTYLLCVGILLEPIQRLVNFARLYQEGITGFDRFMEMIEVEPDIQDAPNARELNDVQGEIEFRNVSFKYRDHRHAMIKNISLRVKAGEYVALVGASGVGKSTLCALIPRFYEIHNGEILLDNTNIQTVTLRSLRRNIGIVQQDTYLFAGTVAENIRYGKLDATNEEIVEAAKKANAHEFIMALPHGYATEVGQRGIKLSGGQKQRLSIARVFLRNPPIIIFDEATSALDNESEKAVQDSLEKLASNRTTIVIAHRLTTIRNAQRIVVLTSKGEAGNGAAGIGEQGTHDELMAAGGVYASLYNMRP